MGKAQTDPLAKALACAGAVAVDAASSAGSDDLVVGHGIDALAGNPAIIVLELP